MGGVSVSHLVLFIASLVVAAGVAGTLVTEVDRMSQSVTERSDIVSESIQTDLEAISDTGSDAIYDDGGTDTNATITMLAKNTGSVTLIADSHQLDVLVDGQFIPPEYVTIERADNSGETAWETGSVVEIVIDVDAGYDGSPEGDTRVAVRANGNEAVMTFRLNQ